MKLATTSLAAIAAFTIAGPASAGVLLTDNFDGIDPTPDRLNVNYNLAGRQTGTQATQSWTRTNNAQVGDTATFGGTGEYLQVANSEGSAQLTGLVLSSSLVAANEKLVISFTADVVNEASPEDWMSFNISPSAPQGPAFPIVGSGDFGFLLRANGGMAAFNNGVEVTPTGPAFSTSSGVVNLTFTFSGADGTGSAFAGNGTQVSINDGTSTWTTVLDTGLTSETISFGSWIQGTRGMVENLSITTIPGVATDYDTWLAGYPSITDPADKLPGADPDGDSLTNQQEYAFGLAPDNGASCNPITAPLDKATGKFSYTRRATPAVTGLTYTVWTSEDLATWTEDTTATTSQTVTGTTGDVQTVEATITGSLPLAQPKLFLQVRAE